MKNLILYTDFDFNTLEYEKIFFGDTGQIARQDVGIMSKVQDTFDYLFSKVWHWKAINFTDDGKGFLDLPDFVKRIFLLNNGYQILMDSGVESSYNILSMLASNTSVKTAYYYIAQNENIHANSYSYGILQMFRAKATQMLNEIENDTVVKKRMNNEINTGEELLKEFALFILNGYKSNKKLKIAIIKELIATLIIEDGKFPFSFFTTLSINNSFENKINGFSNLIRMIARDEIEGHVVVNIQVLNQLRKNELHGFVKEFEDLKDWINNVIDKSEEDELQWSEYLLKEGEFPGFSKNINEIFIKYRFDHIRSILGIEKKYKIKKSNYDFLTWFDEYRKIQGQSINLQEMSNNNYEKGQIKKSIKDNLESLSYFFKKI